MKTKIVVAAALVTFAALGSAGAADLPAPAPAYYKAPPPAPVYNWTGCYIAGGGGYGMWNQDSFVKSTATGTPITASQTNGGHGWFGLGQGGCDYEFTLPLFSGWSPRLVVGAFGDWDGGDIFGTSSFPGVVGQEKNTSSWFAGGRVGYVVSPRFLTYADGGWTQARFDQVNYNVAIAGGGPSGLSLAAQTYSGWFVGSGFEYSLDWLPFPGLFLKTEYRYSQYNSPNGTGVPIIATATGAPSAFSLNSQKAIQTVSTELVWRFNFWGH